MQEIFQTELLPSNERQDNWRQYNLRLFPSLRFYDRGVGTASSEQWKADEVSLIRYRCYPHDVVQVSGPEYLKLLIPRRAGTTFSDGQSSVELNPGDLIVYDMSAPYTITNAKAVDHQIIVVPQSLVRARGRHENPLRDRSFCYFDRQSSLGYLLAEFIACTFSTVEQFNEAQLQAAADAICHLLRSTLDDATGKTHVSSSSLQYIYTRAVQIIEQSLRDENLTVDELVRKLNCCRRSLYASFNGTGYTPKEMILSKRLEGVRGDLRNPHLRERTILEIIYAWGFEDQKNFCRLFKERYGITANAYRKMKG